MLCGWTRVLVPAALAGLAVATVTGTDTWGFIAAALVAGGLALALRRAGTTSTCELPAAGPRSTTASDESSSRTIPSSRSATPVPTPTVQRSVDPEVDPELVPEVDPGADGLDDDDPDPEADDARTGHPGTKRGVPSA